MAAENNITAGNTSLYLDYESYDFDFTTWEMLDPKTFNVGSETETDKMDFFGQFIDHKVKFFAYLNFFSKDPTISIIQKNFEGRYSKTLTGLKEEDIVKNFANENDYKMQEAKFIDQLTGDTKRAYVFFTENYQAFFNTTGNGFFVNIGKERLIEKDLLISGNRSSKIIKLWSREDINYINKVIRVFPLLYFSEKHNNAPNIQFVCFIDGYIRNSIDYFTENKIQRIYLPVLEPGKITPEDSSAKVYKAITFTANANAMDNYLKKNQISLHFNPDVKPFETNLILEPVTTNRDLRGCSIY